MLRSLFVHIATIFQQFGCSVEMSLHSGIAWLADGFNEIDQKTSSTWTRKPSDAEPICAPTWHGDGGDESSIHVADVGASNLSNSPRVKIDRVRSASHVRSQSASKQATGRQRSHSVALSPNTKYVPYTQRIKMLRSEGKASKKPDSVNSTRSSANVSVPENLMPRSGGWMVRPMSSGSKRKLSISTNTESMIIYNQLPTHPDLRYFDRHSKCFNHSQGGGDYPGTRPSTACASGKSEVVQCECCGEITSQLRYRYGPTGSAMMEMQMNNKTYLYPDRIVNFDSFRGKQRPCSAPSTVASVTSHTTHTVIKCMLWEMKI